MDIGCRMYHADQRPYTGSDYLSPAAPTVGGNSALRSRRLDWRCAPALTGKEGGRRRWNGQSAVVEDMSEYDGNGCVAWVLTGRLNASDAARSTPYRRERRHEAADSHQDAPAPPTYRHHRQSGDHLHLYPDFDVEHHQRRPLQTHASAAGSTGTDLNLAPFSITAARLLNGGDQHGGAHRAYDPTTDASSQLYLSVPRPPGTSQRHMMHQRQHDRSPDRLVNGLLDLRLKHNYERSSSKTGSPRYGAYDYSRVQNCYVNGGSNLALDDDESAKQRNGLRGPHNGGMFMPGSPSQFSSSTMCVTSLQSPSHDANHVSPSSRLDVSGVTMSPRLEAHELSLCPSAVSLGSASKTAPRRSDSTSSSSSSSSTPSVIRRHLRTFAQSLDVRLAAFAGGGGRTPVHARSRTSRHDLGGRTHRKATLTRSNSEPEALERVADVHGPLSGDDECRLSDSCSSYGLHQQRDDDTRRCSTTGGQSSQSATKLTLTGGAGPSTLSSPSYKVNMLPKLRRGWSDSDGVSMTYPTSILQLTDEEQHQLARVAVRRLHDRVDLPCAIVAPKHCSVSPGRLGAVHKLLRLKRYVHSLDSVALRDLGKNKNMHRSSDTTGAAQSGHQDLVFGVSLSECVRRDVAADAGRARVSPSSESSLLDALLLLQSANPASTSSGRVGQIRRSSRLVAHQLYDEHYCSTMLYVPRVVRVCCRHLQTHGLNTPGIFRVAGSKSRVTALRQEFDSGVSVELTPDRLGVHDVASLLKEYLRDLPDPLLTRELFQAFLATAAIVDVNRRVSALRYLVTLLPTVNRDTLWYLLTFLGRVAKHCDDQPDHTRHIVPGNKMDSSNLATVFGPTVLRRGKTGSKFQLDSGVDEVAQNADVVAVVKDLIDFHAAVFRLTKQLYDEVLDALGENGTLSCELDVTAESADNSHVYNVQLDAADSSEGSFRTSSSGCDVDCPSSSSLAAGGESSSSHHQQLSCSSLPSTDVTASPPRPRCHGNAGECGDWESQRWRHWQRLAMTCDRETDEQLTLV